MARYEMAMPEQFEVAAASGAPDVFFELGLLYSSGRDADPDMISAHKWFNLAALKGNKRALEYRKEISQEMSRREIAEAQKKAREWLTKH